MNDTKHFDKLRSVNAAPCKKTIPDMWYYYK